MGEIIQIPPRINTVTPVTPADPVLFDLTGATDAWYLGELVGLTTSSTTTRVLGLTLQKGLSASAAYTIEPYPITGPGNLSGLLTPCNNTNGRFAAQAGVDNIVSTAYDLTASDSFTFVMQTCHANLESSNFSPVIFDWGTKTLTSAGFYVELTQTYMNWYFVDNLSVLHTTTFAFPGSFNPWKDGNVYTWIWRYNKASAYGTVSVKKQGTPIVDYAANCSKLAGVDFSALGAITFSGKSAALALAGANTLAPTCNPIAFFQVAYAKNLTYDPGDLI